MKTEYLPLPEAIEQATGRRPHISTALRWCTRGSRGIRLESRVLGGRRLTTVAAVLEYMEKVTSVSPGGLAPTDVTTETPAKASLRANQAAKKLADRLSSKSAIRNGR